MACKRRRRTASLATTTAVAAATLARAAVGEPSVGDRDASRARDDPGALHPHHPAFRRRLAQSAAAAFASWRAPEKASHALPLDLKIDASTGAAFVQGLDGYLEPYERAFRHNSTKYWDSVVAVESIVEGLDGHERAEHEGPKDEEDRLYYKILEEDGIEPQTTRRKGRKGLRGSRENEGRALQEKGVSEERTADFDLDSIGFRLRDVGESDSLDEHPDEELEDSSYEMEGDEEEEEEEETFLTNRDRSLQDRFPQDSDPTMRNRGKKNKNKNKDKDKGNNDRGKNKNYNNNKKKKLPRIDRVKPSDGQTVREKQTFSCRVQPSASTKEEIAAVSFRLEDHTGASSGWLAMPKISDSLYEITVNGFTKYPGTKWKFTVEAKDKRGKKQAVKDVQFVVEGVGGSGCSFGGRGCGSHGGHGGGALAPPAPSPLLPKRQVNDSDWPHGGAIQAATGRIMFEFDDGTDQSFVCSGTVVMDGRRGRTPDGGNGRTVIQSAAHCAYNDVLKQFASRAVFIPDQDNTRGNKSDFEAENDPYGAWFLSFATVAAGWADGSFPDNVPFDYAYWTVFNDNSTHEGGYKKNVSGILDQDVTPMMIDFDADPFDHFVFSIGYSADKDPRLRHCAMANTAINGVPWYTNLWLKDCAMTGGASGGPWMADMDEGGTGTLISVNSWGFTHKPGMAGPVLRTSEGSWAECLFEKAKTASDPGRVGGIIVRSC